jgi:hypothetical protein
MHFQWEFAELLDSKHMRYISYLSYLRRSGKQAHFFALFQVSNREIRKIREVLANSHGE